MIRNKKNYKVRVLFEDYKETIEDGLTYEQAIEEFLFYTRSVITYGMNVRSVKLMNEKGTIKMFSNKLN